MHLGACLQVQLFRTGLVDEDLKEHAEMPHQTTLCHQAEVYNLKDAPGICRNPFLCQYPRSLIPAGRVHLFCFSWIYLLSLWTVFLFLYFCCTLKAVVKMNIQNLFVIITFSKPIFKQMVTLIGALPLFGASLQKPFRNYLEGRRAKLHRRAGEPTPTDEEPLMAVGKVMIIMV